MSLKARLEKLETKANPQGDKDLCVFIVGYSPNGDTEITGYRHDNDVYMRLAGESDDELRKRVELATLSKTEQNNLGYRVAIVHTINAGD
jgi:hypothetical protein